MHQPSPRGLRRARRPLLLSLALLLGACARSEEPIVFGVVGPFETPYGAPMRMGAELALREINAAGGVNDRPLRLRFLDDHADPDRAIVAAESLYVDPKVVAVVGHVNSAALMAAGPTYQRGLPVVAAGAISPLASHLGAWVYRVGSTDSVNAVKLAGKARRIGKPAGIIYENDGYGRGLMESFRTTFEGSGGRVIESDPYLKSTKDVTPYLERMKRRGTELVFLAGLTEDAVRIIQQAHAIGFFPQFLGGSGIEGLVSRGSEFDGTLVGLLYHRDMSPEAGRFAERFRTRFNREPDAFAALGYDATRLLARAAAEAGPKRKAIRDYLSTVGAEGGTAPFAGVTGAIHFGKDNDPVNKAFGVGVLRAGKIILDES